MGNINCNVLISGAGIMGLTIAKSLAENGIKDIVIIEKESDIGFHASGRNSGVLHAGIYYSKDSLKAKFCLEGNIAMKQYCKNNEIPLLETGKVIVCKSESELDTLTELYNRAKINGAKVDLIDPNQLNEIEPLAKTIDKALFSYYTAIVDPKSVIKKLKSELIEKYRVQFFFNQSFMIKKNNSDIVETNGNNFHYQYFINASGVNSDIIAHQFNLGLEYKLIPFKGIYYKLNNTKKFQVNGNIYPVPDIRNPFLGVHFTRNMYGDIYLGPTAIPALGRENYGILDGLSLDSLSILKDNISLFFKNAKYRSNAYKEPRKYIKQFFYHEAKQLVKELNRSDIVLSDKIGIRPQLVHWPSKEMVMDYLVLQEEKSIHLLNTISPAFTSSFAFSQFIVNKYILNNLK